MRLTGIFSGLFPGRAPVPHATVRKFERELTLPCVFQEASFYPLVRHLDVNREVSSARLGFVHYSSANLLGIGLRTGGVPSILNQAINVASVPQNREGLIYGLLTLDGLRITEQRVSGILFFDWKHGFMDPSAKSSLYTYLSDMLPDFMTVVHQDTTRLLFEFSGGGPEFAKYMRPNIG